jgi:hypothetical protein
LRTNNTTQAVLPVDEATVQERSISVKVLTIGTKQITQSLYKQLVQEPVIDDCSGELLGDVWGWVNLHDNCIDSKDFHIHAIWEDDGVLKKSYVYLPWKSPIANYIRKEDHFIVLYKMLHSLKEDDKRLVEDWTGGRDGLASHLEELKKNWYQSYRQIEKADQLFIAVSGVWK